MFRLIVLAVLLVQIHAWVLTSNHINVIPKLTTDVRFHCSHENLNQESYRSNLNQETKRSNLNKEAERSKLNQEANRSKLNKEAERSKLNQEADRSNLNQKANRSKLNKEADKSISESINLMQIRIVKRCNGETWENYAKIGFDEEAKTIISAQRNVNAKGHLGKLNEAFLSITWSVASHDTVGNYKCLGDGFNQTSGKPVQFESESMEITNDEPSVLDLVNILLSSRNRTDMTIRGLEKDLMKTRKNLKKTRKNLRKTGEKLRKTEENLNYISDNLYRVQYWPEGSHHLWSPATGCPSTIYSKLVIRHATIRYKTKEKPKHSLLIHMKRDTFVRNGTRNYLNFHLCRFSSNNEHSRPWPKGEYCFLRDMRKKCPTGLIHAVQEMFLLSSRNLTKSGENIVSFNPTKNVRKTFDLNVCCKEDGDPDVPILLPNKKPFYLIRYEYKCQSVYGMNVDLEMFYLHEKYKHALCYYYPKTRDN